MSGLKTKLNQNVRVLFNQMGVNIEKKALGQDLYADIAQCADSIKTIFDVGANAGEFVRQFAEDFPDAHIYAFEPDARVFAKLLSLVNSHKNKNISPQNIALGDKATRATLNLTAQSEGNSFLPMAAGLPSTVSGGWTTVVDTAEVEISTVDQFCKAHDITAVDLLKIDTQGYDHLVLQGAHDMLTARRIKLICIEVVFVPLYDRQPCFSEVCRQLAGYGYCLVDLYNKNRKQDATLTWCDALFKVVE